MSKSDAAAADAPADFETALGELEQLVERLESGDLSLAEALSHFERGVSLSRRCHGMLDQARQTVVLLGNADDPESGQPLEP